MNMSQSILRMRVNFTLDTWEPNIGIIYSYINSTNYDMVLYGWNTAYLLSVYNGGLYDTVTGVNVSLPGHALNHWHVGWTCNSSQDPYFDTFAGDPLYDGVWVKTLYNEYCGGIFSKAWGINDTALEDFGQFEEPQGWIVNESIDNLTHYNGSCFGLVVWNPKGCWFTADFDFIRMWRLNYSLYEGTNEIILGDHSPLNGLIPYMEFPNFNMTTYNQSRINWLTKYYDWLSGGMSNLTFYEWCDFHTENMSQMLNLEARYFGYNYINCTNYSWANDQNDSVYYYTAITDDMIDMQGEDYNSAVRIHIEDCTDGTEDIGDGCVIAIDIDNNQQWDYNDYALVFYDVGGDVTNYTIWSGTNAETGTSDASTNRSFFVTGGISPYNVTDLNTSFPVFHRYSWHRTYDVSVPLYTLRKENKEMLNINDIFGLHIMTFNAHDTDFPVINPVWENWNQTTCSHVTYQGESYNSIWETYLNCSTDVDIGEFINGTLWDGVNSTNMQYWGLGVISNTTGYEYQDDAELNVSNVGNQSSISAVTVDNWVEYNITVCNNGSIDITDVKVNLSLANNVVYLGSNLSEANVTNPTGNYYIFNLTSYLRTGHCLVLNISTRFPAGCAPNGTTIYAYANAYGNNSGFSIDSFGVSYGDNHPPEILFMYPTNTSTTVSILNFINNISVNITDADGDTMNVTFYTNKTDLWPPGGTTWYEAGSNTSVTNGTFYSNASLNTSVWYWGNTTYYWWVNVSDGKAWTNESYWFTTTDERFDVNHNYFVNVQDVSYVIAYYSPPYLDGIYDVNGNSIINVQDVSFVIANYT